MPSNASHHLPLEGIRVADLSLVLAGTSACTLLSDWGAEVIRLEPLQNFQPNTRGRLARPSQAYLDAAHVWVNAYPDFKPGRRPWNRWPFFQVHARNKLSMTLDMKSPEGLAILKRIVAVSDIVIENNVPETLNKLGISYPVLRKVKPDLIMVRMPGYGLTGPYANYRSLGSHLEGTAGHTYIRGYADSDPTTVEDIYFGDAAAGVTACFAAMAALHELRRTGKGQLIELAQVETVVSYFSDLLLDYQMNRRVAKPGGNDLAPFAPHNTYQCSGDDRWVAIAVSNDKEWQGLVKAMGNPEWASDAKFSTQAGRFKRRRELDQRITQWTRQHENQWAMARLQSFGVPAGVLNDERDAYADPHLNARGFFETLTHPDTGTHRYPGIVWKMVKTPNKIRTPPPMLGEHNKYAYAELLGVPPEEYKRLEAAGHIGDEYPPHVA
ncbi:MAG: CoA transferase [Chloroflexi bacterium]|nr:CoA transferase [Chloroflexota bacterium]